MQNINKQNITRYSDRELEEFKILIERKLTRTKNKLKFFTDQLANSAGSSDNKTRVLDDGISTAENANLANMAARQQKYVQYLENAIIRINNKVYGICRETGKLIRKERLKAVPHATLCMEAKITRK